ncbi:MAG: hypothetical protein ACYCXP_02220 [Leptospirillum sp.]
MRNIGRFFYIGIFCAFLAGCASSDGGSPDRNLLLDQKSTRFYVIQVPQPKPPDHLILVGYSAFTTDHRISFTEFLRLSIPPHSPGHYYLTNYSRTVEYASTAHPGPGWVHPFFGHPYRYRYQGDLVMIASQWAKIQKKREKKIVREEKAEKRAAEMSTEKKVTGPDGGEVIQADEHSLTEVLPSGAYIVHPKRELVRRGLYWNGKGWVPVITNGH